MLEGVKRFVNGAYIIRVDGYPQMRYYWYSKREAEKHYREKYGLKGKRITWYT